MQVKELIRLQRRDVQIVQLAIIVLPEVIHVAHVQVRNHIVEEVLQVVVHVQVVKKLILIILDVLMKHHQVHHQNAQQVNI